MEWLDRTAYPFASHYLDLPEGRLHYVDEGDGPPVVMLHGNPTWSYMYRHLIRGLAGAYRCVAPDYLGFGLSDKPYGWSYRAADHAAQVEALLARLDLRDVTLVVHDWGGPIGLSYALRHPERVRRIVVLNTWMWPLDDDPVAFIFSKLLGGPVGRVLIERFNLFALAVMPLAFGERSRLTADIHRHYLQPLGSPEARKGSWVFPRELTTATPWLRTLWAGREALVDKPALLCWGMRDLAFRKPVLDRWRALLPHAAVHRLDDVGHYVAEEAGPSLVPLIAEFLETS